MFATVAFFITIAVIAALASVRSPVPTFRRGLVAISGVAGVAAVAAVVLGATRHLGPTGFATSCTGAALMLVATLARRSRDSDIAIVIEGVGVASLAIGVAVAAGSPGWLPAATTAGALAVGGAAVSGGALFGHRPYRIALPIIIVLAADAWLAAAGIGAVETYTIPLGAAFVIAGATARNWYPQLGSWEAYAPGLVVAMLPSLVLLLDRGGSLRLIGLITGGTVSVVVGAAHRLQAPMLLGAAVIVTIGIDALSPVAAGLPRWIPLGTSGLVILWIGITFERRLNDVRHLRDNVRSLQ